MDASARPQAVTVARGIVSSYGLPVDEAVVINDSNKLTLRLRPCDVVARVAPVTEQNAAFELGVARRLVELGSPVAVPYPHCGAEVHEQDGFMITFWTYYPSQPAALDAAVYAHALGRLHADLRSVDIEAPAAADRVFSALELVERPDLTPDLPAEERRLVTETLHRLGPSVVDHAREQLLHGEPHPGNVLNTRGGPVIIDFETACRGPVEFDLAHAPEEVATHYPGLDRDLLQRCRTLMLAMIIAWRWDPGDRLPDSARLTREWKEQLRRVVRGDRS